MNAVSIFDSLKKLGEIMGVILMAGQAINGFLGFIASLRAQDKARRQPIQIVMLKPCPICKTRLHVPLEFAARNGSRCRCSGCRAILRVKQA